jgi:hypothetical protein
MQSEDWHTVCISFAQIRHQHRIKNKQVGMASTQGERQMKRLLLAVAAAATIGLTATSAQAGGPWNGWDGHHHHHRHHNHYRQRNFYRPPPVCSTYVVQPPVVYQPYVYYPPQNSFFYQGRNFGMQFGW